MPTLKASIHIQQRDQVDDVRSLTLQDANATSQSLRHTSKVSKAYSTRQEGYVARSIPKWQMCAERTSHPSKSTKLRHIYSDDRLLSTTAGPRVWLQRLTLCVQVKFNQLDACSKYVGAVTRRGKFNDTSSLLNKLPIEESGNFHCKLQCYFYSCSCHAGRHVQTHHLLQIIAFLWNC